MRNENRLCHTTWDCKYHIVWIPKRRRKILFGKIREYLGPLLHKLAGERECRILEGHVCRDHIHVCIEIPTKYPVSKIVGYLKGKSAINIARDFEGRARNFVGQSFWARGYYVSTVGRDEATIRAYILNQEKSEKRLEHLFMR